MLIVFCKFFRINPLTKLFVQLKMVPNILNPFLPMDITIHLAWILGPFYLIAGIWLLTNQDSAMKMLAAFKKMSNGDMMILYGAFINIILGLVVLSLYREWVQSWEVLITIVGWISILKGVGLLFKPDLWKSMKLTKTHVMISALVFIVIGGVFLNAVYTFV
jgi:hypothetical protein